MPDRIGGLHPLSDLEVESGGPQGGVNRSDEVVDMYLEVVDILADKSGNLLVGVWFLVSEPDVLHLGLDLVQSEPVG